MTAAEKLQMAVILVSDVKDSLNQERSRCDHCGLVSYSSQTEWIRMQQLEAVLSRLRKVIQSYAGQQ